MGIDYPRFWRVLDRSERLAGSPNVKPIVRTTYQQKLAAPAGRFKRAHKAIADMESRRAKEQREAFHMLVNIRDPYNEVRAALQTFLDGVAIPPALSSAKTPNEKYDAISSALALIDAYNGSDEGGEDEAQQWAKDLTDGPFYSLAPTALREIDEWIEVNGDHEEFVQERALAYAEAYPHFLRFRTQVRASYGSKSIHYRRLLVKSNGKLAVDDVDDVPVDSDVTDDGTDESSEN